MEQEIKMHLHRIPWKSSTITKIGKMGGGGRKKVIDSTSLIAGLFFLTDFIKVTHEPSEHNQLFPIHLDNSFPQLPSLA